MPSLPEAVDLKYGDDYPDLDITEVACVALSLKRSPGGRQRLPSVLILAECEIENAGDETEVERRCEGVRELDLSRNKLKEWDEVFKILRHLPSLCFLNLSYNALATPVSPGINELDLSNLSRLVLNGTRLGWSDVHSILGYTPRLEELHLCMNEYRTVEKSIEHKYHGVTRVHFNHNPVSQWSQIESLGFMFPTLEVLILAECPLVGLSEGRYREAFPSLKYLSLNGTKVNSWDSVDFVNRFPMLSELRLQMCPLYESYGDEDRRQLTIARLWRIQRLNGGALITPQEREDAERAFIRYYIHDQQKPQRYEELIRQHGELNPLVEINLKPPKEVTVKIRHEERIFMKTINVYMRVVDLKKALEEEVGIPWSKMRLYYHDQGVECGIAYAPEELKIGSKQIYTTHVHNGDEFIVDVK